MGRLPDREGVEDLVLEDALVGVLTRSPDREGVEDSVSEDALVGVLTCLPDQEGVEDSESDDTSMGVPLWSGLLGLAGVGASVLEDTSMRESPTLEISMGVLPLDWLGPCLAPPA